MNLRKPKFTNDMKAELVCLDRPALVAAIDVIMSGAYDDSTFTVDLNGDFKQSWIGDWIPENAAPTSSTPAFSFPLPSQEPFSSPPSSLPSTSSYRLPSRLANAFNVDKVTKVLTNLIKNQGTNPNSFGASIWQTMFIDSDIVRRELKNKWEGIPEKVRMCYWIYKLSLSDVHVGACCLSHPVSYP